MHVKNLNNYNKARQEAARKYNKAFQGIENITTPKVSRNCDGICDDCDCHVFHQYTLKISEIDRDALAKHLNDNGIPCGVYYPVPLHRQKAYIDPAISEEDFPVTNQLVKEVISLPMHSELSVDQIEHIAEKILAYLS